MRLDNKQNLCHYRFIKSIQAKIRRKKKHLFSWSSMPSETEPQLRGEPHGPFILWPHFWKSGSRKVVLEKWFFKLGFFFLVNHFSPTWNNVDLWYRTTFFSGQPLFSKQISRTRFLKPLSYAFLENSLQNHLSSTWKKLNL